MYLGTRVAFVSQRNDHGHQHAAMIRDSQRQETPSSALTESQGPALNPNCGAKSLSDYPHFTAGDHPRTTPFASFADERSVNVSIRSRHSGIPLGWL